ncbi:MAG: hypothetical protein IPJ79_05220 [Bacteroidetes bacterium]|nr:hypothetical protein [Bacteroidota bacterium]
MKKRTNTLMAIAFAATVIWTGCKKDEDTTTNPPPPANEEEVITTMKLAFVDSSNNSNIKYATFRDPDGDGGLSYDIFDTIKLEPNKTWITTILLLNETESPADTISNEVLDEGVDHLFCFTPTGTSATVIKTDLDNNGLPIGLQSKWYTTVAGNGTMQVELRHQPGVKDGTCTPGDTDISVDFQVKVQ